MTNAQREKAAIYRRMGYDIAAPGADGSVLMSRDMPKGKTVFQVIDTSGLTIRSYSRPTEVKET